MVNSYSEILFSPKKKEILNSEIHATIFVAAVQSLSHVWLFVTHGLQRARPGIPVLHHLPELAQTHVHRVSDAIQPSHPLSSPSPSAFNLSQHLSFPMSLFFASGGQSIGASASASVLPMNIQD